MDCGRSYPPICMDFDHVRGVKRADISQMLLRGGRYSIGQLIEEVGKCDVICSNCHRIRTQQRTEVRKEIRGQGDALIQARVPPSPNTPSSLTQQGTVPLELGTVP